MIGLKINKMNNAFGIKTINVNADNKKVLRQALIYSNNGTFKTSFAKSMYYVSKNELSEIKDRLTNIQGNLDLCIVDENENVLETNLEDKIIVFSSELYRENSFRISNYSKELQFITADKESKDKLYKILTTNVEKMKEALNQNIKKAGLKSKETINLLCGKTFEELNINDLEDIFKFIQSVEIKDISKINLKNLFGKPYTPIDNVDFIKTAKSYVEIFDKILREELFDADFNDSNCNSFIEIISDIKFLNQDKGRGVYLKDKVYFNVDEIKKIFSEAIKSVSDEPAVLSANRELVKAMGKSKDAEILKEQFRKDPTLIYQLSLGRKKIVAIALKNCNLEISDFLTDIDRIKREYTDLIQEAQQKKSQFEKAIEIYINRFKPKFDIIIDNKKESILGIEVPILLFVHKYHKERRIDENEIKTILSSGEKTALNIIGFLVNYEANKDNNPIIVLDDIVETFDYKNRHAFIEYISDIVKDDRAIIILTHNYEFYRTLRSRVRRLTSLCAYSKDGKVYIEKNDKINFDMEKIFEISNEEHFIFSIPYMREVKTMIKNNTGIFDSCLHYKETTKDITFGMIRNEYPQNITINVDDSKKYLDVLLERADHYNVDDRFNLKSKTILAIACRVLLEQKIIGDNFSLIAEINENQLAKLKDNNRDFLSQKVLDIIDEVQIATPEFIHGNAFMYEPLVDIEADYLFEIYNAIKKINNNEIWI